MDFSEFYKRKTVIKVWELELPEKKLQWLYSALVFGKAKKEIVKRKVA